MSAPGLDCLLFLEARWSISGVSLLNITHFNSAGNWWDAEGAAEETARPHLLSWVSCLWWGDSCSNPLLMEALRKEIPDYLGIFPKHRTPLYGTPRSKKKKGLLCKFWYVVKVILGHLVTNKKNCSHKYNMTLWTNPTGENSIQAKWEIGKTAPANMISLWEQIQMWKWPPAEIRNGRRTCLVIQLGNCGIFRTLFCRICILRHGRGQFTITCHRCSAIFLQDQPLFSNFPLFEVLETQLTFKSVGEPD